MIKHLSHKEIDKPAWDNCIHNSVHGMIYGTSWYLDQLSPGWEALVSGDYQAVMPLPVKIKWTIPYLIRPAFCQQLGVFSTSIVDKTLLEEFLKSVPSRFKWINIPLNEGNSDVDLNLVKGKGINYLLPLSSSYEALRFSFVQNTRRNLAKAGDKKIIPEYSNDINGLIALKKKHAFSKLSSSNLSFLKSIFDRLALTHDAEILSVLDEERKMIAGALFIRYGNRWIYLLSTSSELGKSARAMFAIVDKFIRDHAGKEEILDFEGSMIPELARFFAGFGAVELSFPVFKLNRLPFPLNLIRK